MPSSLASHPLPGACTVYVAVTGGPLPATENCVTVSGPAGPLTDKLPRPIVATFTATLSVYLTVMVSVVPPAAAIAGAEIAAAGGCVSATAALTLNVALAATTGFPLVSVTEPAGTFTAYWPLSVASQLPAGAATVYVAVTVWPLPDVLTPVTVSGAPPGDVTTILFLLIDEA